MLCVQIVFCQQQVQDSSKYIEQKVDSIVKLMTLDEKIGQMNQYVEFWKSTDPIPTEGEAKKKYNQVKRGLIGAVLNVKGATEVRKLQELAVYESRLGIPLLFGADVIHGYQTQFPIPLAEASSWDLSVIEKSARIAAIEASAAGLNWTFAPMVDISRDARWGRVMEGAGEDPHLGSAIANARVKGFQGDNLSFNNTIAACAKHFAGYGFAEAGRDYNTVDVGTSTLYNVILPPFKSAVDQNVQTFMTSYNILNGIPTTGDATLLRQILKQKWQFRGFVVSDWGSGEQMVDHGFAKNKAQAAELSANAGLDMDMESYIFINHLKQAVKNNSVRIEVVNEAVRRILRVKYKLGLFDDPFQYCDNDREKTMIGHEDHEKFALELAKKSIVLLKNKQNILPIDKKQKKIALIGPLADDKDNPLGNWRAQAKKNSAVSVLEGLRKYTNDLNFQKGVDFVSGTPEFGDKLDINMTNKTGFREAIQLAKNSDIVIMVLGEHALQSGESRSRAKLGLPGLQQQLLEAIFEVNTNIVLVLMNGRPLTLTWADEHVPAILEAWHLGSQSGNAIAQVLFGDHNPGGKLTMTFPRSVGQIPIYYNHYNTGRPGPLETVLYSRYTDESKEPLYPFGHGLSYTSFAYSDLKIDSTDNDNIKVSVTVKNIGEMGGEEITQVYICDISASVTRPVKELKGFSKFFYEPNESRKLEFIITDKELGFYNNLGKFVVEPGEFEIMVGTSSQKFLSEKFIKKK